MPVDPTSNQKSEQLPTYNAYSIDGDVTGAARLRQLRPARGLRGARALRHLGEGRDRHRALRRVVARHQAEGRGRARRDRLPHLSPIRKDDGFGVGDVFPKGPMRPADGVQRGSVMDMPVYPGDPLTPGVGATPGAKRLAIKDATTLTKIPVLPISYGDAQPLLAALTGAVVPGDWRGGLPITYHFGPGAGARAPEARLQLGSEAALRRHRADCRGIDVSRRVDRSAATITTRGSTARRIRSAAWRPSSKRRARSASCASRAGRRSGRSSTARGTARSRRCSARPSGPRRTPPSCSSTRWPTSTPTATAAAFFRPKARTSLEHFINDVARDIEDPETHLTVWKRQQAKAIDEAKPEDKEKVRSRADLRIGALGSGSDFTPFLQHLGIADAQPRLRRRGRRAASTTRSTTTSTSTRTSPTPTSSTAARWRRPSAPR